MSNEEFDLDIDFDALMEEVPEASVDNEKTEASEEPQDVDYDFTLDLSKITPVKPVKNVPENTTPEDIFDGMSIPRNLRDWLKGIQPEIPPEISKMMGTFVEKINWTVAFLIVQNIGRISHLIRYLSVSEKRLMDIQAMESTDPDELLRAMDTYRKIHKEAQQTLHTTLEFIRKFTQQSKESLASGMGEADELAHLFRELPPAVINELRDVLKKHGKSQKKE